jgi:hypothetical protein
MNWFRHNWQLKLTALGMAVFLWLAVRWSGPVGMGR